MAKGFNLTAELNLRGPANVRQVVSNINKQLKNIKGTVNLTIDPNSAKSIAQVNKNLVQLQKNLNNVRSSARAVSSNLSGIGKQFNNISTAATKAATTTQNAAKNINSVGQQSQAAANQIGKAGTLMESFGKQSALAVKRFAAFSLVTSTVFSLTNAINQAFKQFVEFDRQLVRLQQVTGKTAAGLKGISQEISNLSQSLGVSSSDLISVSTTLAQAGLSARETEKALKALALSALAPSFDDLNRTVEGSIALMRQFGISAGDLEKALGSVNAVAANFAVEAGDIIAAIQRTGGVFAAASRGVS
jgi:chromosome segregation ATPase